MESVKLSSKNQIVIPKQVRQALGVGSGDELFFVIRQNIFYLLPKQDTLADAIKGILKHKPTYPKGYLSEERSGW